MWSANIFLLITIIPNSPAKIFSHCYRSVSNYTMFPTGNSFSFCMLDSMASNAWSIAALFSSSSLISRVIVALVW